MYPALLGVAWLAGLSVQQQQARLWPISAYLAVAAGGLALAIWALARRRSGWARWLLLVAVLALGASYTGLRALGHPALDARIADLETHTVQGVITDWVKHEGHGQRFMLRVDSRLDPDSGQWLARDDPLRLTWYRPPPDLVLRAGQRWEMRVRVRPAHGHRNPGAYDSEWRAWRDRLAGVGYVRAKELAPRLLARQAGSWGMRLRTEVRQRLLALDLWAPAQPWLLALVLGDRSRLTADDWAVLQATGTAHLLSVSGLHITVWSGVAWALAAGLWWLVVRWLPAGVRPPERAPFCTVVSLLAAAGYAGLAGWGVPVQRAWLMLAIAMGLRHQAARWPMASVVGLAAVAVTVWDPWALREGGFWLSFGAVMALTSVLNTPAPTWRAKAWALWATQWRIGWMLMPLVAWRLGQVSWLGFGVNLLAIPWVTALVLPLALLGLLWPPAWFAAAWALQPMVTGLQAISDWGGGVSWVAAPPAALALLAAVALWWAMKPWSWPWRVVAGAWVVPMLLWREAPPVKGEFSLLAWDVGQGSAILVRTANHSLLYDTGPSYWGGGDAAARWVVPGLRRAGITLDRVMLSHQDHDHIGGQASVLAAFPQAEVWAPFRQRHGGREVPARCLAGRSWTWDGVNFQVLHPERATTGRARNADSCVLRISQGSASVILTGDIGVAEEAALLSQDRDWRTSLLVAAHHGSKTSSSWPWLQALSPRWVWVQAGYRNRYGHPSAEVLARFEALGLPWHNTADCGALRWSSEAPERSRCTRVELPHYWALHQSNASDRGGDSFRQREAP